MTNFFKKLKEEFIRITNSNKLFLVFLLISFVLGISIAIINLISFKNVICLKDLTDFCLSQYFANDISLFAFFLKRFFVCVLIFLFVILICFNKYTSFLLCLLTLYLAYMLVFNMGVVIVCFGFFGVIFAFINILMFSLLYLFIFLSLGLFCKCVNCRNYFFNLCSCFQFPLFLMICLFILCLLEMLLLPFLSSTFIIIF